MNLLKKAFLCVAMLSMGVWLFGDAAADTQTFAARRKASGQKVDALRARLDAAGASDIPVAFALALASEDARLVGATVLAFELHKGKPPAVLMASAAKNARSAEPMRQVPDRAFKTALMQAPQEMDSILETYQALDDALALDEGAFNRFAARAVKADPQARVRHQVTQSLQKGVKK